VVDVLATDVYRNGFDPNDYDQLLALAGDRPIALGEVGTPPTPEKLREQPRWTWFMVWAISSGERTGMPMTATNAHMGRAALGERQKPKIHYPILK